MNNRNVNFDGYELVQTMLFIVGRLRCLDLSDTASYHINRIFERLKALSSCFEPPAF